MRKHMPRGSVHYVRVALRLRCDHRVPTNRRAFPAGIRGCVGRLLTPTSGRCHVGIDDVTLITGGLVANR